MTNEIITRAEALSQGLIHYFTGKPCHKGHVAQRRVKGSGCVDCCRERVTKFEQNVIANDPRYNQRRHLKRVYGLTLEQYDQMLLDQDNKCLTCHTPLTERAAHIDHCHTGGQIRGILCGPCNQALGLVQDDPQTLQNMIDYLKG